MDSERGFFFVRLMSHKLSGGTAAPCGSRFVGRILSVVDACRQQKRGVLEYLGDCHSAALGGGLPLAACVAVQS